MYIIYIVPSKIGMDSVLYVCDSNTDGNTLIGTTYFVAKKAFDIWPVKK